MFNMGPMEIAVILIVALLVVGPKKLPEIGKTLGKSLKEFRKVQDDLKSSIDDFSLDDEPTPPRFDRPPATSPEMSAKDRRRHRDHRHDEDADDDEAMTTGEPVTTDAVKATQDHDEESDSDGAPASA